MHLSNLFFWCCMYQLGVELNKRLGERLGVHGHLDKMFYEVVHECMRICCSRQRDDSRMNDGNEWFGFSIPIPCSLRKLVSKCIMEDGRDVGYQHIPFFPCQSSCCEVGYGSSDAALCMCSCVLKACVKVELFHGFLLEVAVSAADGFTKNSDVLSVHSSFVRRHVHCLDITKKGT